MVFHALTFNISLGTWRTLKHYKTMFDRYYCIKTKIICYISRYFLPYFVSTFHRCHANAISTDYTVLGPGSTHLEPISDDKWARIFFFFFFIYLFFYYFIFFLCVFCLFVLLSLFLSQSATVWTIQICSNKGPLTVDNSIVLNCAY